MARTGSSQARTRRTSRRYAWETLTDEQLLSLRFCDLKLSIEGTDLQRADRKLYGELATRGIRFRPHCWLSQEWFSPDGIPGIAIPFYLAHPRLVAIERRLMREVEGGNRNWLMRILRHEAGHAIDSAYRLRRRRRWREIFGPASLPYPDTYRPRPGSRRFVQHLGAWYAQAHPTEDFAETFAVWLKPRSTWRREYSGWPAFAKLAVHRRSRRRDRPRGAAGGRRTAASRTSPRSIRTLRQHYARKLARYRMPRRSGADELLQGYSPPRRARADRRAAATVLREMRQPLRQQILRSGAFSEYLVHQVLRLMIERCDALNLYVRGPRRELKAHLMWVVARLAESYEERRLPRVAL